VTEPLIVELRPAPDPLETVPRFAGLPYLLFLDSASREPRLGRYSFLAADPVVVIRAPDEPDPIAAARSLLAAHTATALPGLPPFQGGIAGYLGYDWGARLERVRRPPGEPEPPIPDVVLGLYDWVIAWDHGQGRAWIISTGIGDGGRGKSVDRASRRLAEVQTRLRTEGASIGPSSSVPRPPSPPVSNFSQDEFEAAVARVQEHIRAGDIFQANLSQRFRAPRNGSAFELYRRLRARTPAPFAAYLAFGDAAIASASPERFLRVDADGGRVETRPIKGTRPRGRTARADAAAADALLASEKDRAENVMIVDVLRNDLGRVCRLGSVTVPELGVLESHPTVHHLVSTVVGELAAGRDALDLLAAAFPGGSITGAPKIRAMQIIAELERGPRGPYCGAIGYLSVTGALDTSIVIRTFVVAGEQVTFHAGAGIVADSDPAAEYQETLDKAAALMDAVATSPRKSSRTPGPARRPASPRRSDRRAR
jgi:para-aminobenzoate synthetase component 1